MGPLFTELFIESSHFVPIRLYNSHSPLHSNAISEKWNIIETFSVIGTKFLIEQIMKKKKNMFNPNMFSLLNTRPTFSFKFWNPVEPAAQLFPIKQMNSIFSLYITTLGGAGAVSRVESTTLNIFLAPHFWINAFIRPTYLLYEPCKSVLDLDVSMW